MMDRHPTAEAGADSTAAHGRSGCTTLAILIAVGDLGPLYARQPDAAFAILARDLTEMGRRGDVLLLCRVALRLNPDDEAARSLVGENVHN